MARRRSFWGWGYEGDGPTRPQQERMAATLGAVFGIEPPAVADPPTIDSIDLPAPTRTPPGSLAHLCSDDRYDRAAHTYGKSYRDLVRGFRGDFSPAPDLVAHPRDEADVVALLDWCSSEGVPAVPFGGGSSVVGGVECAGAVSTDLT